VTDHQAIEVVRSALLDILEGLAHFEAIKTNTAKPAAAPAGKPGTLHDATRAFQRRFVSDTLMRRKWNVTAAARDLDITRAYLYVLIKTFGLKRDG
jgi:transcriptional regulator with GAF, ATPase, and Fis domain